MASRTRVHCPTCGTQYQPYARRCEECGRTRDQLTDAEILEQQQRPTAPRRPQQQAQKPTETPRPYVTISTTNADQDTQTWLRIGRGVLYAVGGLLALVALIYAAIPAVCAVVAAGLANGLVRAFMGRQAGVASLAGCASVVVGIGTFIGLLIYFFSLR